MSRNVLYIVIVIKGILGMWILMDLIDSSIKYRLIPLGFNSFKPRIY